MAGLLGYGAGFGGTRVFFRLFMENSAGEFPLKWALLGGSVVLSVVIGMISSAYPALMAARLDPNEALRAL